MKKYIPIILGVLGIFVFAKIVKAGWLDDEMNQQILQLGIYGLIDYNQSATAFYNPPAGKRYIEINPILGEQPERKDLIAFGVAGVGTVYLLKEILPDNWNTAKQILIDSVLSTEQFNIEENVRVALGQKRIMNTIPIILTFRW